MWEKLTEFVFESISIILYRVTYLNDYFVRYGAYLREYRSFSVTRSMNPRFVPTFPTAIFHTYQLSSIICSHLKLTCNCYTVQQQNVLHTNTGTKSICFNTWLSEYDFILECNFIFFISYQSISWIRKQVFFYCLQSEQKQLQWLKTFYFIYLKQLLFCVRKNLLIFIFLSLLQSLVLYLFLQTIY